MLRLKRKDTTFKACYLEFYQKLDRVKQVLSLSDHRFLVLIALINYSSLSCIVLALTSASTYLQNKNSAMTFQAWKMKLLSFLSFPLMSITFLIMIVMFAKLLLSFSRTLTLTSLSSQRLPLVCPKSN